MIQTKNATVYIGNNLDILPTLPDSSVDSIVTDPPYELGFMGKSWDSSGIAYNVDLWRECLRVLKPGGHLLAFSGSRTYHRMVVAIEDAGFEIRDMISWISNKTFPKSLDVSKAIDKKRNDNDAVARVAAHMLDALKKSGKNRSEIDAHFGTKNVSQYWFSPLRNAQIVPADKWPWVREWLGIDNALDAEVWRLNGRKKQPGEAYKNREVVGSRQLPKGHSFASEKYGKETGTKEVAETLSATDSAKKWEGWGTALKPTVEPIVMARKPLIGTVAANVLEHGTGALNIDGSRIGAETRTNSGMSSLGVMHDDNWKPQQTATTVQGRWPANVILDEYSAGLLDQQDDASRFFYVAKASKRDRNEGLEGLPLVQKSIGQETFATICPKHKTQKELCCCPAWHPVANFHPTVKPTTLMRYLVKLVTPPGGTVLDPFTGSGSTGKAAILEGFTFIGCEMTEDYVPIIQGRLEHAEATAHAEKQKKDEALF